MPTVLITGANRGLGLEFVRQYRDAGWEVVACCRRPEAAPDLAAMAAGCRDVRIEPLDVVDFGAIDALADRLADLPIDVLVNNAGLFGPKARAENDWRQSFGHLDYEIWRRLFLVNTQAPLKLCEAFVTHVAASTERKMVAISSSIGSIAGTETGVYAYRSTKAALNSVMATLANELRPQGIAVGIYCPGWVRTRMGGAGAALMPEESVRGLRERIGALTLESSGRFVSHDGEAVPW